MHRVASRSRAHIALLTGLLLLAVAPRATAARGVSASPPNVSISPKTQTVSKQRGVNESESFVVTNTGNSSGSFTVTYTCSAILGCSPSPQSKTLAAGATWTVTIPFTATATGTGTITVTASTSGASDQAVTTVNVFAPGVTVSPSSTSVTQTASSVQTGTFTVTNTGGGRSYYTTGVDCTGALASCSVSPSGFFIDQGAQQTVTATYTTGAAGTTGSLSFTAYTTGVNSTGTINVTSASGTAAASVTPKGTTVTVPSWTQPTQNFTVTNSGSASGSFTIVKSCGGSGVTCTGSTTTQTIGAGVSVTVGLTYDTHGPPPLTGWVRVKATDGSSTDSATVNVNAVAPGGSVAISPSSVTKPASSAQSSTFTVNNTGTATSTYTLAVVCTGALTACSVPAPTSVTIAAGGSASVPVNYTTGAASSTGTIQLTASTPNITPSATLTVTAAATSSTVSISPKTQTISRQRAVDESEDFVVTNTGTTSGSFTVTYTCSTILTCSPSPRTNTLAAGQAWTVSLPFTGNTVGSGTLTVTASTTGASDQAVTTVNVFAPGVTVSPTSTNVTRSASSVQTDTFTVTNTGGGRSYYTTGVDCTGALTSCSVSPSGFFLDQGVVKKVAATYTTGAAGTTGSFSFTAYTTGANSNGTINVTSGSGPAAVAVTPKGSSTTLNPNTTGNTFTFTVQNTGSATTTFALTGSCSGAITCSAYSNSISPNAGVSTPIQLTFNTSPNSTGTNQTGTLTLSASGGGVSDAATYTVTVTPVPAAVSVTPVSTSVTAYSGASNRSIFTIQNTGGSTGTFNYSIACPAAVTNCTASSSTGTGLSGQTSPLAPSGTFQVTVDYTGGSIGATGSLDLTAVDATNGAVSAVGRYAITVGGPFYLATRAQNLDGSVARDACLDIPLGKGASYECGDLRVGYALPAITTMSKTRQPALLFLSSHANASATIEADVALPSGLAPTQITASATINGVADPRPTTFSWNPSWSADSARRLTVNVSGEARGLGTGVHNYTLEISAMVNGVTSRATSSGFVTIVNRINSAFGRGWWLQGLEELVPIPNSTKLLWVGGDGSTRVFTQTNATTYTVQQPLTRSEILTVAGQGYRRVLPNGAYTEFNTAYQHVATVNDLGHRTTFDYVAGQLQSITLPTFTGVAPSYRFTYQSATDGRPRIDAVHLAGTSGFDRPVIVTAIAGGWVTGIRFLPSTDPASALTSFGYTTDLQPSGIWNNLTSITDPLNNASYFDFEKGKLTRSRVALQNAVDDIYHRFRPAELLGRFSLDAGQPQLLRAAYAWIDGPRNDVPDTTKFYVNRFGLPDTVVNALGARTRFYRDSTFPLFADTTIQPNGLKTHTYFSSRGLIDSTKTINPFGPTAYDELYRAVTRYEWDNTLDKPLKITAPDGEVTQLHYDSQGNLQYQENGLGAPSRTNYTYHDGVSGPSNLLKTVTDPLGNMTQALYSSLGDPYTITAPTGEVSTFQQDEIGRTTSVESPVLQGAAPAGQAYVKKSTKYDVAGRDSVFRIIGPDLNGVREQTQTTTKYYDLVGRLITVIADGEFPTNVNTTTVFRYDRASRRVAEDQSWRDPDGSYKIVTDSVAYDPASNALSHVNRNGFTVTMQYDTLNRLVKRTSPPVSYQTRPSPFAGANGLPAGTDTDLDPTFPRYPLSATNALSIAGDVAKFGYDVMGNLTSADNSDALIRRTYTKGGAIETDSLWIRDYSGSGFGNHKYGISRYYDLSGRTEQITHPDQLAGGYARTRYTYDTPATGQLYSVTDARGYTVSYNYGNAGELRSSWEGYGFHTRDYDGAMNVKTDALTLSGSSIRSTTAGYDARGKMLAYNNQTGWAESLRMQYSGMGHLIHSDYYASTLNPDLPANYNYVSISGQRYDALGNIYVDSVKTSQAFPDGNVQPGTLTVRQNSFDPTTGRQTQADEYVAGVLGAQPTFIYDSTGSTVYEKDWRPVAFGNPAASMLARSHYYDAQGHLRVADSRTLTKPGDRREKTFSWSFEEYRYDALGRRVLVRSRRMCNDVTGDAAQAECRISFIRRTVWDGDAELYEIQMPGRDADFLEEDILNPGYPNSGGNYWDVQTYFGRVAYTYGIEIDQPVSVIRYAYADASTSTGTQLPRMDWPTFSFNPLWNLRGQMETAVFSTGNTFYKHPSDSRRQAKVDAPQGWYPYARVRYVPRAWMGSLLEGKADKSGLAFRRNRLYDPATGRFTQEDPIGLAGGANRYGYAGGDPANYSDPFGLCPFFTRLFRGKGGCESWNKNQLNKAFVVLNQEQAAGNPDALAVNPADVKGVGGSEITKKCRIGNRASRTGCNAPGAIYVNVDRNPVAISQTMVHEQQHANESGTPKADESCAQLRAVRYEANMTPQHRQEGTKGSLPTYNAASPNVNTSTCAGL